MNAFNSFRNHLYRFFTKEEREESLEMQPFLNKKVMELFSKFGGRSNTIKEAEFFFYSDEEDKANNLAIELNKMGYKPGIYPPEKEKDQWAIIGCTGRLNLSAKEFDKWSEKMVELGYECDCKFDGWGTIVE